MPEAFWKQLVHCSPHMSFSKNMKLNVYTPTNKDGCLLTEIWFLTLEWYFYLISCQYFISMPPEIARKPKVFWRFQGAYKWNIDVK